LDIGIIFNRIFYNLITINDKLFTVYYLYLKAGHVINDVIKSHFKYASMNVINTKRMQFLIESVLIDE